MFNYLGYCDVSHLLKYTFQIKLKVNVYIPLIYVKMHTLLSWIDAHTSNTTTKLEWSVHGLVDSSVSP